MLELLPSRGPENWRALCAHLKPLHDAVIDATCKEIVENNEDWPFENSNMKTVYVAFYWIGVAFRLLPLGLLSLWVWWTWRRRANGKAVVGDNKNELLAEAKKKL